MRKPIVGCVIAAGLVLGVGGNAFAGEYNGNGDPVPGGMKGKSACSYSGRDIPDDVEDNPPGRDDDGVTIHGVQSYGQYVSQGIDPGGETPGQSCRGN